jgi:hypothetical protein
MITRTSRNPFFKLFAIYKGLSYTLKIFQQWTLRYGDIKTPSRLLSFALPEILSDSTKIYKEWRCLLIESSITERLKTNCTD